MKNDETGFTRYDVENCDKLADLLQELESEVKTLHHELEAETIRASVFRHKLTFFHSDFKKEIEENVRAARDSNTAVILELKERLDALTKNIQNLHKRDKELSEFISLMEPEKKSLISNHEITITSLNTQMAEKAEAQIKLNETKDNLRDTNKGILELEEDIIVLREELIKEKAIAREEKIRLEEEKYKTNQKANLQEEHNEDKARELDGVQRNLDESNKSLRIIYRENEKLEEQINNMEMEIEECHQGFIQMQKNLEASVTEGLRLTALEAQTQQDYHTNKALTIQKTKEATERTKVETENLKLIKELQDKKRDELKLIYDRQKDLQVFIDGSKQYLDNIRSEIGVKFQEIAEMEMKNQSIYQELSDAQESHNQVMDSLMRESEELREQLSHERQNRLQKQQTREAKLSEIENFNATVIIQQANSNRYLNTGKEKYSMLIEKEKGFNESIGFNTKEKERLVRELDEAVIGYGEMKERLEARRELLETDIQFFIGETEQNAVEVKETTPGYEKLCEHFNKTTKEYEETRHLLISTKNKKSNLESLISNVKRQIADHDNSRVKVSGILKEKREAYLKKMKENNEELKEVENEILHTGLKLQTVKRENDKFINAIKEYETDFNDLDLRISETSENKELLQEEFDRLHRQLVEGWQEDKEIEDLFARKDRDLIRRLGVLFSKAKNRETKVNRITDRLYQEIGDLDKYINNMIGKLEVSDLIDREMLKND